MKPLHVRVAEALGITLLFDDDEGYTYFPGEFDEGRKPVPRYDIDWSATGPLIEKYRIELSPPTTEDGPTWGATRWDRPGNAEGPTALVAVCNLILALHAAGKLEP